MRIINLVVGLVMRLIPSVLAADILHLYYTGGWYEPVKWIETTEIFLLYLFAIGFFLSAIWYGVKK